MMYYEKIIDDDCGFQSTLGIPSTGPILTVLGIPNLPQSRRIHRFHPFSQQQPTLYRPHLLPTKPSPVHVSDLPPEILAIVFSYLDVRDKGTVARVCSSWRAASYNKSVWKNVEAKLHLFRPSSTLVTSLALRGIRRVQILSLRKSFREITQGIDHLASLNLSGCYNIKDDNLGSAFTPSIPTLLHLDLSICKHITDKGVQQLVESCPNLETLELGGCSSITDIGLSAISRGLKRLKCLNLRSCWNITDQGIRLIAGQTEESPGNLLLQRLGLQDCQHLSDDALKHISQGLTSVNSVNLSFCINISDIGLKYLARMTSLRELNLHSCDNISDAGLAFMAEVTSPITTLDVSFCDKVTDQSLEYISQGLFNLKCLSLRACHISDEGIFRLAKALSDLEVLNVGQCVHVSDESLNVVTNSFKNLRCVDLYGCPKISAETVADVRRKLPHCRFNLTLCDVQKS